MRSACFYVGSREKQRMGSPSTTNPSATSFGLGHSAYMDANRLVVSTYRRWVADELRAGAPEGLEVVHDLGFDVPGGDLARAAWWTPAAHAARLVRAGVTLRLATPRADLLSLLPEELTGRSVLTCTQGEVRSSLAARGWTRGWAKPADAKVDTLPARHYADLTGFVEDSSVLPASALVQISPTTLEVVTEFRVTMVDRTAVAVSPYVHRGQLWEEGLSAPGSHLAVATAEAAAAELDDVPTAMVLDVALTPSGPALLEANPVWCAAFYGADVPAVVHALLAASSVSNDPWVPDAFNAVRAQRQRVLPNH